MAYGGNMRESLHLDGAVDTHVRRVPRCVRSFGTFRTLLSRHHWRELERWLGGGGGGGGGGQVEGDGRGSGERDCGWVVANMGWEWLGGWGEGSSGGRGDHFVQKVVVEQPSLECACMDLVAQVVERTLRLHPCHSKTPRCARLRRCTRLRLRSRLYRE